MILRIFLILCVIAGPLFPAQAKAVTADMKNPQRLLDTGELQFKDWETFYTYIATLHDMEPSTDNLLGISIWSTYGWRYDELMGRWLFVMKIDSYKVGSNANKVRETPRNSNYYIGLVEKNLRLVGAFYATSYKFGETVSGLPSIVPYLDKGNNCCTLPALLWDGNTYKPATEE